MNKKTKDVVMAALLTALSLIITFSPFKLVLPTFTLTLGSHVPTMLAIMINPWVAIMTVIGSCIGFMMAIPMPNSIIVMTRAAMHLVFALAAIFMIRHKRNVFLVIGVTAVIHAFMEGLVVYILTPIVIPNHTTALMVVAQTAFWGTFVHHFIDCAITVPIYIALTKAGMMKPVFGRYSTKSEVFKS